MWSLRLQCSPIPLLFNHAAAGAATLWPVCVKLSMLNGKRGCHIFTVIFARSSEGGMSPSAVRCRLSHCTSTSRCGLITFGLTAVHRPAAVDTLVAGGRRVSKQFPREELSGLLTVLPGPVLAMRGRLNQHLAFKHGCISPRGLACLCQLMWVGYTSGKIPTSQPVLPSSGRIRGPSTPSLVYGLHSSVSPTH